MKKIIYFAAISILLGIYSCDQEDIDPGQVQTKDVSGEWWVVYSIDGSDVGGGFYPFLTYNTASDLASEFWVDDEGAFWTFKGKVTPNLNNLTFGIASDTLDNGYYESQLIVQNGKIIKGVSLQPSGILADSIYFEVRFSDDGYAENDTTWIDTPYETVFQVSGFRRTGFEEDEH